MITYSSSRKAIEMDSVSRTVSRREATPFALRLLLFLLSLTAASLLIYGLDKLSTPQGPHAKSNRPIMPSSIMISLKKSTDHASNQGGKEIKEEASWNLSTIRDFVRAIDSELLDSSAPDAEFLPDLANPCWNESASGVLKCLPGAYLIGGFHAGTRAFARRIQNHPQILSDAMSFGLFWSEERKMADFVAGFQRASNEIKSKGAKHNLIFEGSPCTFTFYPSSGSRAHKHFSSAMAPCWRNCSDKEAASIDKCMDQRCFPLATKADEAICVKYGFDRLKDQHVPLLMKAVYGNKLPKLIVVLRNPIDRIASAYYGYPHYHTKFGRTWEGFHTYVSEQIEAMKRCTMKRVAAHGSVERGDEECVLFFEQLSMEEERVYFHADQLLRGTYSVYLSRWLEYFKLGTNLLVVKFEELEANSTRATERALDFLGLDPRRLKVNEKDEILTQHYSPSNSSMLPATKDLLQDFYRPYNTNLSQLLKDDHFKWDH